MAILGRSKVESFLRKPTVVAASVTFQAIVAKLVAVKTGTEQVRHSLEGQNVGHGSPNYVLRPPVVVAASTTFRAILARLAVKEVPPQVTNQRGTLYKLNAPTAVAASVTFRPVQEKLARTPRAYVRTSSRLRAPTVVAPLVQLPAPIKVRLDQPARSNFHTIAKLRAPTVVAPSVVYGPVRVGQARPVFLPAQRARGFLRPPGTLQTPTAPFVASPVSTKVARTLPRAAFRVTSRLRPPAIVAPSVTFGPLVTKLAPSARQARKQHSRLLPVPFFASPTKTRLTTLFAPSPTQGPRTSYRLGRVLIVGVPTVITFLTGFFDPSSFTPGQTNPTVTDFDPETHNADAPNATVNDFDPPNPR